MLQQAQLEDIPQLAKVKTGFGDSAIRERFEWLNTVHVSWYVWWKTDEPRGWVLIHWNGKPTAPTYPDLCDLYVSPRWQGQGIGTQILAACEQIVREAGYSQIGLAVNPDLNPRAHLLYQRLGYYTISPNKYLDGVYNGVEDWVIDLEKNLA